MLIYLTPCDRKQRISKTFAHPAGFSDKYEQSVDPLWRQTFFLYIRDLSSQSLEVAVESITEDEEEENILMGRAEMKDLRHLCDGQIHDITLDLEGYRLQDLQRAFFLGDLALPGHCVDSCVQVSQVTTKNSTLFCRKEGSSGKVELSVRYQEHSDKRDLLGEIKEQVCMPVLVMSFPLFSSLSI